jgi:hypothetical protein
MAESCDHHDRDRDRPLSFHWHAPDLSRELGLPPARNAAHPRKPTSGVSYMEAVAPSASCQAIRPPRSRKMEKNGQFKMLLYVQRQRHGRLGSDIRALQAKVKLLAVLAPDMSEGSLSPEPVVTFQDW